MRKLNWTFLVGLLTGCLILGVGTYFVHGFQVRRNSTVLLDRARANESAGKLEKAAEALKQYLALADSDRETWRWYADVVDRATANDLRRRAEALRVNEEALNHLPGDEKLERRCAEIALENARTGFGTAEQAANHITMLIERRADATAEKRDAEKAELLELRGDCKDFQSKNEDAAKDYKAATIADPGRLSAFRKLAGLQRVQLQRNADADNAITQMVESNPGNGIALLYRYLYNKAFRPPVDRGDLEEAIKLSPDDPEVLLAAATDRLQQGTPQALKDARAFLEKGIKLAPGDEGIAFALAGLEQAEKHPEEAANVLRRAYESRPDANVAYRLCLVLIDQNKLGGEDGAKVWAERLRTRWLLEVFARTLEGRIKMKEQDWSGAIADFQAAINLYRDRQVTTSIPEIETQVAECYRQLGYDDQYRDTMERIVNGGAVDPESQLRLARALLASDRTGDRDKAMNILKVQAVDNPILEIDITSVMIRRARDTGPRADWRSVEAQLAKARSRLQEAKLPQAEQLLILLEGDKLVGQGQLERARKLFSDAVAKFPSNLRFRLALAQVEMFDLARRPEALKVLDQAERNLGPSAEILMARLTYWGRQADGRAKEEIARLAKAVELLPTESRQASLRRLAETELAMGDRATARQHFRELAGLQPGNLEVVLSLFDLAQEAQDDKETASLIDRMYELENPGNENGLTTAELAERRRAGTARGTYWRYAEAASLLQKLPQETAEKLSQDVSSAQSIQRVRELVDAIEAEQPTWWGGPLLKAKLFDLTRTSPTDLSDRIKEYQKAFDQGRRTPEVVGTLVGLMEKAGGPEMETRIQKLLDDVRNREGTADVIRMATGIRAINRALEQGQREEVKKRAEEVFGGSRRYIDRLELARYNALIGDRQAADQAYQAAISMAPAAPECRLRYVEFLAQTGQRDKARAAIQEASSALPPDKAPLTLAACLATIGDIRTAEAMVEKALVSQPQDPATLRFAGQFYTSLSKPREAMRYLDQLTRPEIGASLADVALAYRLQADLLMRTGRTEDLNRALDTIERNLRGGDSPVDKRMKAVILSEQGKTDQAIKLLDELKRGRGLAPLDQYLLARLFLKNGNEKEYEAEIRNLLDKTERLDRASVLQLLAQYTAHLLNKDKLDDAARQFAELKKRDPQGMPTLNLEIGLLKARNGGKPTPEIRDLLVQRASASPDQRGAVAELLARNGFATEAEEQFKAYVSDNPSQPQRELSLAVFLAGLKNRAAEAMEHFKHAAKACPPEQVAATALSLYDAPSVTEEQRKQVETWLAEAVQKRPDLIELANKLVALWIRDGRIKEAEAQYRSLLERNPANPEALNNLAWMLALQGGKKAEEAQELIDRAIKIQGPTASLRDTLAVVKIRSGKDAEALAVLAEVAKSAPSNYSIPLHLAWAQLHLGKKDEARKAFQQALSLGWSPDRSDPMERELIGKVRQDLGL